MFCRIIVVYYCCVVFCLVLLVLLLLNRALVIGQFVDGKTDANRWTSPGWCERVDGWGRLLMNTSDLAGDGPRVYLGLCHSQTTLESCEC